MKACCLPLFCCSLCLLFSCNNGKPASQGNGCLNPRKVSERQLHDFSDSLATAMNRGDANFFNQHFSLGDILRQATQGVEAPQAHREGFVAGVGQALNVGEQIVGSLGFDGYYKLLRIRNYPEQPSALFRLTSSDGLNYHELLLCAEEPDSIRIADFHIYMGGISFSSTLERLYLSSLAEIADSISYASPETEKDKAPFLRFTEVTEQIGELNGQGKPAEALQYIAQLPDALKDDKMIMMMRLNLAFNQSEEAYANALADFERLWPGDPLLDLMQLDFGFTRKDMPQVLNVLDSLDAHIGGDPYLKIMRANIFNDLGNKDSCEVLLRQAIAEEPDNEEGYWSLLDFLLQNKRHDDAVALFRPMSEEFKINPAEFLLEDGYDDFWESGAYKRWEADHPLNLETAIDTLHGI